MCGVLVKFLPSPLHSNSFWRGGVGLIACWNFPLGRLDLFNFSFVCGCLPRSALSRCFPLTLVRGVGASSLLSWIHGWGRLFPSPLAYSAGAHSSYLFMDGCLTLKKGETKRRSHLTLLSLLRGVSPILFLLVTSRRPSRLSSSAEQ